MPHTHLPQLRNILRQVEDDPFKNHLVFVIARGHTRNEKNGLSEQGLLQLDKTATHLFDNVPGIKHRTELFAHSGTPATKESVLALNRILDIPSFRIVERNRFDPVVSGFENLSTKPNQTVEMVKRRDERVGQDAATIVEKAVLDLSSQIGERMRYALAVSEPCWAELATTHEDTTPYNIPHGSCMVYWCRKWEIVNATFLQINV